MNDDLSQDLVERIARAICASNGFDPDEDVNPNFDGCPQPEWLFYQEDAKVAIRTYLEFMESRQ